MTVLGIDIGRSGAAPLLDESGAFVAIHHMPTLDDGPKGRPAVNAALSRGTSLMRAQRTLMSSMSAQGPQMAPCRALFSGVATLPRQGVAIRSQEFGRTRGSMPDWSHWAHAGGPAKGAGNDFNRTESHGINDKENRRN
jgi:hypothetical protein